jgi:dihydrofolate reductase
MSFQAVGSRKGMRNIVVTEFVTLDGVMEDPGGSEGTPFGGWALEFDRGSEGDRFKLEELREADGMLLGRKTYEGFAAAWPSRSDEQGFAERMNSLPKYVVSSTLSEPTWNATAIGLEEVAGLEGNLLVAGSQQLAQALFEQRLVDEVRLVVFPTSLGAGKKLFEVPVDFTLVSAMASAQVVLVALARNDAER